MPAIEEIEALIREYQKLVFHTIYGLTGDWEESQDLTQDTFHQALRGIDAARSASGDNFHPKAWLLRIALNTVRMQRRRRNLFRFIPFSHMHEGRETETDHETVSDQAIPVQPVGYGTHEQSDPAEFIAEQETVRSVMAKLPEPLRVCLLLSIIGGLSTSEIASMLDLNEPAVRQRLVRARKQFQLLYEQESGEQIVEHTPAQLTRQVSKKKEKAQQTSAETPRRLLLSARPSTAH